MVEFEVNMAYLEEYGELNCVILHDENGEMDDVKFVPLRTCYAEADYIYCEGMEDEIYWNDKCSECHERMGEPIPNYCPHCGAIVID